MLLTSCYPRFIVYDAWPKATAIATAVFTFHVTTKCVLLPLLLLLRLHFFLLHLHVPRLILLVSLLSSLLLLLPLMPLLLLRRG